MFHEEFIKRLDEAQRQGLLTYQREKPLSKCSSFRIGGPVRYALYPATEEGVLEIFRLTAEHSIPLRVVGSGSNILFPDEGVDGAILFTRDLSFVNIEGTTIKAGAGIGLTTLASLVQKEGLSGLEFGYGIPGSLGGGVYMNAGAYDGELSYVVKKSRYYDRASGSFGTLSGVEHGFSYRHSAYMGTDKVILDVELELKEGDPAEIRATMDDYMARRKSKQPLEYPSAGSAFKRYPGYFTAKLIDEAGLKGYAVGDAAVSEKHAGFVINKGNATSAQVKELMALITQRIYELHGIHIEREIIYF
ncbi:MAG: UDP-N-acetylmuramate dehydrogenase [Clostridia bacterium]|nr:UDP-N-acetylmuramate dehydrogenase [Clostridia bacterium]